MSLHALFQYKIIISGKKVHVNKSLFMEFSVEIKNLKKKKNKKKKPKTKADLPWLDHCYQEKLVSPIKWKVGLTIMIRKSWSLQ